MTNNQTTLQAEVLAHLDNGRSRDEIVAFLLQKGHPEADAALLVKEAARARHEKRRTQGMQLVVVGAVICFGSFLLTITSCFSHSSFPYVLYGLTSVGITVAFCGLMKVF